MTISDGPEISVVIPCRNEAANVVAMAAAVTAALDAVSATFELIFIDNASTDTTAALVRNLCAADPRIKLIINARNFGQMRSPTYGIFQARGRAVIGMCCDFQDPPDLLGRFVERWRSGTDIVLGVRESERSGWRLKTARNLAYGFALRFGDYPVVRDATGFGLYDAKVVRAIAALNEPEPFFRGMLAETGFSIATIHYARPARAGGKSNNGFFALLDFALSSLASTSKKLIRVPFYLGVMGIAASLMMLPVLALAALGGGAWLGWLAASAVELQLGLLFLFLGIIGDQVRLVSERTRGTPLVIERERVNF
ncbi:MAG: glycosyltransferase family 2 protein [Sphingomonas sp.]